MLGLRPFDVQLIGGMILHVGQIAEMRTGEGKTLVAVLPAYLNALTGKGVQVTHSMHIASNSAVFVCGLFCLLVESRNCLLCLISLCIMPVKENDMGVVVLRTFVFSAGGDSQ